MVRIWMCIGISTSTSSSTSISITVLIVRLRQITRYEAWHTTSGPAERVVRCRNEAHRAAAWCSVVLPGAARCFLVLLTAHCSLALVRPGFCLRPAVGHRRRRSHGATQRPRAVQAGCRRGPPAVPGGVACLVALVGGDDVKIAGYAGECWCVSDGD
jgi:hypothetical protein